MNLTREEFEQGYASRSGMSIERLRELGGHGEPCDCEEGNCDGWQMVFSSREVRNGKFEIREGYFGGGEIQQTRKIPCAGSSYMQVTPAYQCKSGPPNFNA